MTKDTKYSSFVAVSDALCVVSIYVHTWSTLSTVMAALVASLMPQCLTRYGSMMPASSMSFTAGASA